MSSNFLIRGGYVLTLGAKTQNYAQADVLVEDGRVTGVGPGLRARAIEIIEAADAIIMPGFVDAHRRCWSSLFKNDGTTNGAGMSLEPTPEDVYAGTLISLLGAIEAGITTVVDWFDVSGGDAHVDAALQAHAEAGVRTVFALTPTGTDPTPPWSSLAARRGEAAAHSTTLAAGLPMLSSGSTDRTAALWARARDAGLRIHTLAGPSERGIVAEIAAMGLLAEDVTLAHCAGLSTADLDAIASSGSGVALTPSSDMATGPGAPPMQDLIDRGIRPGLGVDHSGMAPGDILAQMRSAISIQHATYFDRKLAGKGGLPNLLSTRDVIRYGTIDGAHAIGLADETGSIEVGKQADLIILRTDRPNIHPVNDPIGAVVWGMDTSNLEYVFVGGRALMRNGNLTADATHARRLASESRQRMVLAAGGDARSHSGGEE